jgi:hypothetical protein
VAIKNVQKTLMQKLITKSIAQMNVAELLLIKELWKNIMKRKLLEMVHSEHAQNVKPG